MEVKIFVIATKMVHEGRDHMRGAELLAIDGLNGNAKCLGKYAWGRGMVVQEFFVPIKALVEYEMSDFYEVLDQNRNVVAVIAHA